ncbi:MAG: hypothetical protein ACLQF4_19610 [Xanthobacteraceae bacterium]
MTKAQGQLSEFELAAVQRLTANGEPASVIAKTLNRTACCIYQHQKELGLLPPEKEQLQLELDAKDGVLLRSFAQHRHLEPSELAAKILRGALRYSAIDRLMNGIDVRFENPV